MWHNLDVALAVGHCDTALAVYLSLLDEILAGLPTQADHISVGFNTSHSTYDVIPQISEVTSL